ncbi:hypothetical protein [Salsuginibacillus kocurii]|uniref:hypothetical protein n=1 Tax=Salsuginibacillus kocurii TaxID=427078 RepID=UPI0003623FF0|nr:hypothetical protein [Salsuginibacillus kocurii]
MNPFSRNIEVFIDHDGTLGGDDFELLPGDFWFYPGIKNSIKRLKQQRGVERIHNDKYVNVQKFHLNMPAEDYNKTVS